MRTELEIREQYLLDRKQVIMIRRHIDRNDCVKFTMKVNPLSRTWTHIFAYKALAMLADGKAVQIADFIEDKNATRVTIQVGA
jgi:hypothetical protein